MSCSVEDLYHWHIQGHHQGLREVVEVALLVLEVKEAPDTWHHHCFSALVSANPDCMVQ